MEAFRREYIRGGFVNGSCGGEKRMVISSATVYKVVVVDLSRVSERIEGGVKWKVVDGINKNVEFIVGV